MTLKAEKVDNGIWNRGQVGTNSRVVREHGDAVLWSREGGAHHPLFTQPYLLLESLALREGRMSEMRESYDQLCPPISLRSRDHRPEGERDLPKVTEKVA